MSARFASAAKQKKVLRFVGVVDMKAGTGSVELREKPTSYEPRVRSSSSEAVVPYTFGVLGFDLLGFRLSRWLAWGNPCERLKGAGGSERPVFGFTES
eukprot:155449-Pyramimonas_sp.AAC.1